MDGQKDYSALSSVGNCAFAYTGIETLDLSKTSVKVVPLGETKRSIEEECQRCIDYVGKDMTIEEFIDAVKLKTVIFPSSCLYVFMYAYYGGFPNLELMDLSRCVGMSQAAIVGSIESLPLHDVTVKLPAFSSEEIRRSFNENMRSRVESGSDIHITLQYPSADSTYWSTFEDIVMDDANVYLRYESY